MISDNIEILSAGICLKNNKLYQNPIIRPFIDAYLKHKKLDEKFKLFDVYAVGHSYGNGAFISRLEGEPVYLFIGYVYKNKKEKLVPCFLRMNINQNDIMYHYSGGKTNYKPKLFLEIFDVMMYSDVMEILYNDSKFISIGDLDSILKNADEYEFVFRFKKNYQREDYINFYQHLYASDPKHETYIEKLSNETKKYI